MQEPVSDSDRFSFFRESIGCISASLDMDQVLKRLLVSMQDRIPMNRLVLIYFDYPKNCFKRLGYASLMHETFNAFPEYLHIEQGAEYVEEAFKRTESAIVIEDPERDLLAGEYVRHAGTADDSFMAITLMLDGERIGALIAVTSGRNLFTPTHQELFSLLKEPMALALSNTLRYQEVLHLKEQYRYEKHELTKKMGSAVEGSVIGETGGLGPVMASVRKVAPLDSSVLLLGETGVGKEVIANAVHALSPRSASPFIKIDCGTIPETLVESELFGHEKGAFTGAGGRKPGSLELADGGTVFLDEIGELSLTAQVKLLRLLQHREVVRVGGHKVIALDLRIVCATHRNLQEMVRQGTFREDLWYRLNVFPIRIPPLRERRQDIPALVAHLIHKKAREMNLGTAPFPNNFELSELASYDWPGNVRELENILERWLILGCGSVSFRSLLNPSDGAGKEASSLLSVFDRVTTPDQVLPLATIDRRYIESALKACNHVVGGKEGAAVRLGLPRTTLRSRMEKLGIHRRRTKNTL